MSEGSCSLQVEYWCWELCNYNAVLLQALHIYNYNEVWIIQKNDWLLAMSGHLPSELPFVLEQSLQTELEMKDHAWQKDSPTLASSLSSNCVYFYGKLQTLPTEYFWDQDHATSSAPGPTQPVFHGHKSALDLN